MPFVIRGLGTALPATTVFREDTEQIAFALANPSVEQATWLPNMYSQTGIDTRNVCFPWDAVKDALDGTNHTQCIFLPKGTPEDRGPSTAERMEYYAMHAGSLASDAARSALAEARMTASEITHLITVSCTGFYAPGFDVELLAELSFRPTVQRIHVGFMGCHGALNGLRAARSYCDAYPDSRVLLCAVELCSLHYHYGWDPQKVVANALFADGAAAIVGSSTDDLTGEEWNVVASGSYVIPDSQDAMTWTIGDHGFGMTLSKKVPELIRTHLRPFLGQWLGEQGLTIEDVGSWAIHPGGPKIIEAAEEALRLTETDTRYSRTILAEHGNMSSPTVLFILQRMRRENATLPCVALGFGPGLTAEAALIR